MSSPSEQILRTLAQLQRRPVHTKVPLLIEAIKVASVSEAVPLGMALVECAAECSQEEPAGSGIGARIRRFFDTFGRRSRPESTVALSGLVQVWAHLPPDVRTLAAAAGRGRWGLVTGQLATDQSAAVRKAVAELALGAGDSALAAVAVELLADQSEDVAKSAEAAICFLALAASDPALSAWSDHASISQHQEAALVRARLGVQDNEIIRAEVANAVRSLAVHRRQGVLWAALLLLDPCEVRGAGQLARWINDREQSSHGFLRGLLRRDASPLSRLRAWQWLGTTAVSGASADRVLSGRTLDEHEALFSSWHLMLHPVRLSRLRLAEKAAKAVAKGDFFPASDVAERLSPPARVGVTRLAQGLGLGPAVRDAACEVFLSDTDPVVRFGAARACSTRMLGDFCFDASPEVARSASLRLSLAAIPDAAASPGSERVEAERQRLRTLLRSPHEVVRRIAESDLEALCDSASLEAHSRVALRRAMEIDRAWVLERLRAMLTEGEEARSRALLLSRRLGLVLDMRDPVLAEIRRLLREPGTANVPARGLATAVSALREIPGAESEQLLRESAASADQRVRANALDTLVLRAREGVDRASGQLVSTLLELKEDAWHRVRGSALRGLVVLAARPDAGHAGQSASEHSGLVGRQLLNMLEDSRPGHRLAGAWVADRVFPARSMRELKLWPSLTDRLRVLALTDLEPRVRMRARMALVRSGEPPVREPRADEPVGAAA